jgi:adenylyltransferase/sulfurtransferase
MLTQRQEERYSRHIRLRNFGREAQQKLLEAKVLVIGAGGLGCPVLQYLTSMGVGNIGVMDDDTISISNLHRQVLYTSEDIGKYKVEVAIRRLSAMNEDVYFHPYRLRLTTSIADEVISGYDIVVDTTDSIPVRYQISDACVRLGKPMVYGAIFRWEGQVTVFNYENGPTYRCLFPEPPGPMVMSCDEEGVVGALPGLIGTYQALETIKVITGEGVVLSGRMLCIDPASNRQYFFSFKRKEESVQASLIKTDISEIDNESFKKILKDEAIMILDVRSPGEFAHRNAGGINIPLDSLESDIKGILQHEDILILCQSGVRSSEAVRLLKKHGYTGKIHHLTQGLAHYFSSLKEE